MNLERKEQLKEQAYDDCKAYGTPTMGIDHSNHYKPLPFGKRTCEKCWNDAALRAEDSLRNQSECYQELLKERENSPCSPKEQAGQWWDNENQCDSRVEMEKFK